MLEEDEENADWLKIPSEVAISAGLPKTDGRTVMRYLEEQGLTDTPLYRRLKADPDFEEKLLR